MVIQFNKLLWTKIRTAEILSDADGDNQAAFSDGNISPECDINTNIYPHPVVDMGDSVVIVKKVTDTSVNKRKSDLDTNASNAICEGKLTLVNRKHRKN